MNLEKYNTVRKKLDKLGYQFHFPPDSLQLVDCLLTDLKKSKLEQFDVGSNLFVLIFLIVGFSRMKRLKTLDSKDFEAIMQDY